MITEVDGLGRDAAGDSWRGPQMATGTLAAGDMLTGIDASGSDGNAEWRYW